MTFEQFRILRVPFPFTDQNATKNRPALVLSSAEVFNRPAGHSVLAMITSAKNSAWPLDCPITDLDSAGLSAPSVIRCKLFTLDHRLVRGALGFLADVDAHAINDRLRQLFQL